MTASEIQSKIKCVVNDAGDGCVRVEAWLDFCTSRLVDRHEMNQAPDLVMNFVKEQLIEQFMRCLYADQSRQFVEGIRKLASLPPGHGDYGEWRRGILELLDTLRRQPPAGAPERAVALPPGSPDV